MVDHADDGRIAAYAELVSALSGARRDPASARFDQELAAAEAAGAVDPAVARTLRWWQRESVRAVEDHLAGVLPVVLARLEAAERDAADTVAASAESWALATGAGRPDPGPGGPTPPQHGPWPDDEGDAGGGVHSPPRRPPGGGSAAVQRTPGVPGAAHAPHLRPVEPAGPHGGELRESSPVAHDSVGGGAPPRRLLVAGLTVLPDDGTIVRHDGVPGASG